MKWIKLGQGKDPEFTKSVFLCFKDGDVDEFDSGWLKTIEIEKGEKTYKFVIGYDDGKDVIRTDATHYCVPVSPNK